MRQGGFYGSETKTKMKVKKTFLPLGLLFCLSGDAKDKKREIVEFRGYVTQAPTWCAPDVNNLIGMYSRLANHQPDAAEQLVIGYGATKLARYTSLALLRRENEGDLIDPLFFDLILFAKERDACWVAESDVRGIFFDPNTQKLYAVGVGVNAKNAEKGINQGWAKEIPTNASTGSGLKKFSPDLPPDDSQAHFINSRNPRLIYKVEPHYTKLASEKGIQGEVELSLVVTSDGIPAKIRVLRSLDPDLDQAAIDAVSQWRFVPKIEKGEPVEADAKVSVTFRRLDKP